MQKKLASYWAMGMMSGTSLDGIDVALIRTDGVRVQEYGAHLTLPFERELEDLLHDAVRMKGDILKTEHLLTRAHADAAKQLLAEAGMRPSEVKVIGFHGQTVSHRPAEGITWQIGDGALLASLTRIDVVNDFRRRDVAAGGQGAPLVPLYHAALSKDLRLPVGVVNIGGIGNITWVGRSESSDESLMSHDILAFDTGPGNALINDWVRKHTGESYDKDGAYAQTGKVDEDVLRVFLAHPYFAATPPKSLDRNDFGLDVVEGLSLEDGAATLTEMTVRAIAEAQRYFPAPAKQWLVTGGGRHNKAIMERLSALLPNVAPVEAVGWQGDVLEAQAFAFLAVRSLAGLPLSLSTTTGAAQAVTGGAFHRAAVLEG